MTRLMLTLTDQKTLLGWAANTLGNDGPWSWGFDAVGFGAVERESGKVVAVMVLNAFFDDSCYIHIISDGARDWATPAVLHDGFSYAFDDRKVKRLIAVIPADNQPVLIAMIKIGFTIEGRVRVTADGQKSNFMATMFRDECPWLDQPETVMEDEDGEEQQRARP